MASVCWFYCLNVFASECISGITRSSFFFLRILSNHMMQEKPPYVTFLLTLILSYPGDWILRNKWSIDHQFAHSPHCFFYKYPIFPTRSICSTIKSSLSCQSMILLGEIRFQECCYFSWIGHHAMAGNSSAILSRFSSSGSLLSPTHTYPFLWSPRKYRILLKIVKKKR